MVTVYRKCDNEWSYDMLNKANQRKNDWTEGIEIKRKLIGDV